MRKKQKRRIAQVLCCAGLVLLAFFANRFPFYIYEEEELHTTLALFFSAEHLRRMIPLALILLLSAAGILLALRIRRQLLLSDPLKRKSVRMRCQRAGGRVTIPKPSAFHIIRWVCMIVFSLVVMFGGIFLGFTIKGFSFPVLACPTNRDQLFESSCYFLAHIPVLLEEYTPAGIAVFVISTIGSAALLGRIICGFLCPMGLIQDLMHLIRRKTRVEGVFMEDKAYAWLLPVKWIMVLLMIGLVFAGGEFCNFCPALATSPVLAGMKVSLYLSAFMMILILIGSFFKRRLWCNICPLGYLIGLFHHVSPFRLKKDTVACTECGACYEACPMGIKIIYTEREKTDVTDINCILCGECIRRCPEDGALAMTFAGKQFYAASREKVVSGYSAVKNTATGKTAIVNAAVGNTEAENTASENSTHANT